MTKRYTVTIGEDRITFEDFETARYYIHEMLKHHIISNGYEDGELLRTDWDRPEQINEDDYLWP